MTTPRFHLLVQARDDQGLKNVDLAHRTGLNEAVISRTLRGLSAGQGAVAVLAEALGVPLSAIYLETKGPR